MQTEKACLPNLTEERNEQTSAAKIFEAGWLGEGRKFLLSGGVRHISEPKKLKDLERAKMKLCQTKEHKPASNFYNCTYVRKSSVSALVLR